MNILSYSRINDKTKVIVSKIITFAASFLFSIATLSTPVYANPTGGQVTAGSATITQTTNRTVINQTSSNAIINWQSFNIGANQSTHFQQPTGGIALNRINGGQGASQIYGVLTATGQIILINPAGIYFGPTAYVNVGGLVATTANLSDANFLKGNYQFAPVAGYNGVIVNQGTLIAANYGLIALVGNSVTNNGYIQANLGHVVLGAGGAYTMSFVGNDLINFSISSPSKNANVTNTGKLVANGGAIMVSAQAASGVLNNVINMGGIAEARSVGQHKGEIILSGGNTGVVHVTGKLYATGKHKHQTGGNVIITGDNILIDSPTLIDVSGNVGAGNINIGGSAHGLGPLQNASATIIASGATLTANAITSGNGGNIVVWSNTLTKMFGNINALGGSKSGNGGWVEVSSKGSLDFEGAVNTSAAFGTMGTLLLDPQFLIVQTLSGVAYNAGVNNLFTNDVGLTDIISPASIIATAANIILQANTDVIFNSALNLTAPGATLLVDAGRSILINANISTNNGAITMVANNNAAVSTDRLTTTTNNPVGDTESVAGNITVATGISINSGTAATSLSIGASAVAPFTPGSITLNSGSLLLSTGVISLSANNMVIDTSATPAQIGGTAVDTGNAANVIIAPNTAATIGIAGAAGTLQLSQAALNDIFATNVHIGSNTTSNISSGAWTPAANVAANGVLTLDSAGTITETGSINLATSGSSLLLRDATAVNLSTSANIFSNVASNNISGPISLLESANNNLTIANLTDDLGAASGLTTAGANAITLTDNAGSGNINLNAAITSGSGVIGLTAGTNLDINAGNITTTGNVNLNATNGSVAELGAGLISGALVTTNSVTGLALNNANVITSFHSTNSTSGGVSLTDTSAALTLTGITATGGNLSIITSGSINTSGNLTITNGSANLLRAGTTFTLANTINAGAGMITLNTNYGGTGANAFNMNSAANSAITTTNTSPTAVVIDVNNSTGGTGTANLGKITTGPGGGIIVATNYGANLTGGSITQTAATLLNSGNGGTITLNTGAPAAAMGTNTANILAQTGTLNAATGTGGLFITNNQALTLGTVSSTGGLNVTAGGTINQSGVLTVTGTSTFAVTTASSDILLTNPTNNLGPLAFIGTVANIRNLSLSNTNPSASLPLSLLSSINLMNFSVDFGSAAVTLPEMTLSNGGSLSVIAGGNVTQLGQLAIPGTTTINAGANQIDLNTSNNVFSGVVSLINSGNNNVTLFNNAALQLGNIQVGSGALTLTATGIITQQAGSVITQAAPAGLATFTALGGIALNNTGNVIDNLSISNLVSGNVSVINSASPLTITGITTGGGGNISVNNTGNMTTTGAISTTANGTITLTASGIETIGGAINTNGSGGVSLSGNTINLGANIVTSGGNILFSNPVTLTSSSTINAGTGNINFASTLDGAFTPTLTSSGTLTLGGVVGGTTPLASLTTTANSPGVTDIFGNITTTGSQNYGNPITLSGNSTLATINTGTNITIGAGVNWSGAYALTLSTPNTNSTITLNGPMNGGGGTLNLFAPTSTSANITTGANGSVNVGTFNLQNGFWSQNGALPGFAANDFVINSGVIPAPANNVEFLRVEGGSGTTGSPYQITDVYGLQGIASNASLLGLNYQLINSVNAAVTANWNVGAIGFIPIGTSTQPFTGTFAGQNKIITGLVINSAATTDIGLFGDISNTAIISNVSLTNVSVNSTTAGATNIGTLVGQNNGGSIQGSDASGSLTVGNSASNIGGLVGDNLGTITQFASTPPQVTYSLVNVTTGTTAQDIGGLVGTNEGPGGNISIAYSAGNITAGNGSSNIGGLVGNENSTYSANAPIQNTYSISTIAATGATNVGGLVGNQNSGAIATSYSSGLVPTTGTAIGGFIGNTTVAVNTNTNNFFDTTSSGTGTGVATGVNSGVTPGCFSGTCPNGGTGTNLSSLSTFAAATWNIVSGPSATSTPPTAIWFILPGETRPMLAAEWSTTITTAHQLELMNFALGANYSLANNINLSSVTSNPADVWGGSANTLGFLPIGNGTTNFTGSFSGNKNTISNLTINSGATNDIGLFGAISASANINNINVTGATITSGGSNVGVLVGLNNGGSIVNTSAAGTLTANGNNVSDIGGLVGQNNLGTISAATGTFSHASVAVISTGNNVTNIGGLVGQNLGNGNVNISDAYTVGGSVTSSGNNVANVGGLIGDNQGGVSLTYSLDPVSVSGTTPMSIGGLIGTNEGANGFVNTSYATGTITATNALTTASFVGGLVGSENSTYTTNPPINNTYSMSAINLAGGGTDVGGLVGNQTSGAIRDSYSTGAATIAGTQTNIGGLIGKTILTTNTNNFFDMNTSGTTTGVGNGSSNGVTPESTTNMKTESTFTPTPGWDFVNVWGILGDTQSYPYLLGLQLGVEVIDTAANNLTPTAATNGAVITPVQATNPGNLGTYYYLFNQAMLTPGNPILFYNASTGGSTVGNGLVMPATLGANIAPIVLTITADQIEVGGSNTATFSSTNLGGFAAGGSDILYSGGLVLGNATNPNVTLTTSATTVFSINGGVSSTGTADNMLFNTPVTINNGGAVIDTSGYQTYNAALTLSSAADLKSTATATTLPNGGVTIAGAINGGTSTLTINNADNNSNISGVYSGSGGLIKLGAGTLSVTNANAYTGGTTLSNGTLQVNSGSLGTGTLSFNGGTLAADSANVTLANAYVTGGISTISTIGGTNNLTLSGNGSLNSGYLLNITNPVTTTLSGSITGSGAMNEIGGTLAISGVNNSAYTGTTTISDNGLLQIDVATNALGTGAIILNDGNLESTVAGTSLDNVLTNNGTSSITGTENLTFTTPMVLYTGTLSINNTATTTLAGLATGSGAINVSNGTVSVAGNNSNYTGATTLTSGLLEINAPINALGTGTGNSLILNGGTLVSNVSGASLGNKFIVSGTTASISGINSLTLSNDGTLSSGSTLNVTNTAGTVALSGIVAGTGSITENGVGGTLALSNTNTYTGNNTITAGTAFVTNAQGLGLNNTTTINANGVVENDGASFVNSEAFALNDGTLEATANGANQPMIAGPIKLLANSTTNNVTTLLATDSLTLSGTINGTAAVDNGDLTLSGPGTITLSGIVGGTTPINSLTDSSSLKALIINTSNISSVGNQAYNGPVTIDQNATLKTTGTGNINFTGAVTGGAHNLTLTSTGGSITASGSGAITTTGTVTTSSATGTTLNAANHISTFKATDASSAGIVLINNSNLNLTGITETGTGNVSVINTGSITDNSAITAIGNVALSSTSSISGTGVVTAALLTTNSVTGLSLTGLNKTSVFNATNTSSGNIAFTNTVALNITGISQTGSGTTTVTNTGALTVNGPITNGTGGITLSATGLLTDNQNITATNAPIALTGAGIIESANITVSSGTGNISANAGANTLTLNANSLLLSTGIVDLTADMMAFNTSGAPSQVGGTGVATGSAATVILQPSTSGQTIGIAGGSGGLQLTIPLLNDVFAKNLRIGNATAGNINSAAWTPATNIAANGVLTLDTGGAITQSGAINLSTNGSALVIRAGSATLNNANNSFSQIAGTLSGALNVMNAATTALTVSSLTDDLGTVNGISSTGGSVTLDATHAGVVLNAPITANTTGDSIVVAGATFTNNVGASVFSPGTGNFLVWSQNTPGNDILNGLVYNFKQYNAVYNTTTVLGTGNGLLYTAAPIITPTLIGTVTKVYDGNTIATLTNSNYSFTGAIDGDTVTLNDPTTGVYAQKDVGSNINVSVAGITASATNGSVLVYGYQVVSTAMNTIGFITPANIYATLIGATTKTYDGNNNAALTATNYQLNGVIGSDTVVLNDPTNGLYANPNVGIDKNVSVTGLAISGASAGNYTLTTTSINANIGTITPATLIASLINTTSKVYNATTNAALSTNNYQLSGVFGSDVVNLNDPTSGTYDTQNVGTNKAVSVTGLAISGAGASNYQLAANSITGNIGTITPATLFVQGITANNKLYDNNSTATLNTTAATLLGVFAGDSVNINGDHYIANFINSAVGNNIPVIVSGLLISGASAGNYILAQPSGLTANILASGYVPPVTVPPGAVFPTNYLPSNVSNKLIEIDNYIFNQVPSGINSALIIEPPLTIPVPVPTQLITTIPPLILNTLPNYVKATPVTENLMLSTNDDLLFLLALLMLSMFIIFPSRAREIQYISFPIRTSLESISGFSRLMQSNKLGEMSTAQNEYLDGILIGSSDILSNLIKIEQKNYVLSKKALETMIFNMRTALTDIEGFANLITELTPVTPKQRLYLCDIINESINILHLLPNEYTLIAA